MTKNETFALFDCSEDEPAELHIDMLKDIKPKDIPNNSFFTVHSTSKDGHNIEEIEGQFVVKDKKIEVLMFLNWYRKWWSGVLGMPQYMDLLKRHIELREKEHKDVSFTSFEDEGDWCHLHYSIHLGSISNYKTLEDCYIKAKNIINDVEKPVEAAVLKLDSTLDGIKRNIDLFSELKIEELITKISNKKLSKAEKGMVLEALLVKLFESIKGVKVTERVRTATEEIDLVLFNDCNKGFWKKESSIILVEAKNQTKKTDKNDVVIFQDKIENRRGRCKLGFLVSSAGFTKTVGQTLLRNSKSDTAIVLLTVEEILKRRHDFSELVQEKWNSTVLK